MKAKVSIDLVTPCCGRKVTSAGSMLKRGLESTYRICPKCRVYYSITLKQDTQPVTVIGPIQWTPVRHIPKSAFPQEFRMGRPRRVLA